MANFEDKAKGTVILAGFAIGLFVMYETYKKAEGALNSAENVAGNVEKATVKAANNTGSNVGGWFYDLLHPNFANYNPNAKPGQPGYIGPNN